MNKSLYVDIPQELYTLLDTYCFIHKASKKEIIIKILKNYLEGRVPLMRAKSTPEILKELDEGETGYPSNIGIGTEEKREPYEG